MLQAVTHSIDGFGFFFSAYATSVFRLQIGRRDIGPDERYANIVALSADARQRVESEETARHAPVASVFRSPVAFGGYLF